VARQLAETELCITGKSSPQKTLTSAENKIQYYCKTTVSGKLIDLLIIFL